MGVYLLAYTGGVVILSPILCGSALVLVVLLRRWLRLGVWAWLLMLVGLTLGAAPSPPSSLQPGYLNFLWAATVPGIVLWTCARFGLLTAMISSVVYAWLAEAVPFVGAQAISLRMGGLVVVGLCLVALALALNALRAPRATIMPATVPRGRADGS